MPLEQDREVFAVPGAIDSSLSSGCNWLIEQGATPALSAKSIIDSLPNECELSPGLAEIKKQNIETETKRELSGIELQIVSALKECGRLSVDQLSRRLLSGVLEIKQGIVELEMDDIITVDKGGRYSLEIVIT